MKGRQTAENNDDLLSDAVPYFRFTFGNIGGSIHGLIPI
jgi:hypothetical protein